MLALQGLAAYMPGEVPFANMPVLGGQNLLRGLFGGRYRDQTLVAAQAELRLPVWRWIGLAAFAGDPTNWWIPNASGAAALLRAAGFRIRDQRGPGVYFCELSEERR